VELIVDGVAVFGVEGQTIAGVLLAAGRRSWRTTASGRRPRGVFCGIGVCFDCLVTVNGVRDVRACRRAARDGDVIELQAEEHPVPEASEGPR
jgi:predicted molibdopterin-dependent oxidoreductase YjgC